MNINVNTNLFKVNSYKNETVNVITVLDVGAIKAYEFFCDAQVAHRVSACKDAGERLIFTGYTYKSKTTGNYGTALSSIKTENGGVVYEYKKS